MTPPANAKPIFDDARMEVLMGRLLQLGVLLASTVVLLGGALFLTRTAAPRSATASSEVNPSNSGKSTVSLAASRTPIQPRSSNSAFSS